MTWAADDPADGLIDFSSISGWTLVALVVVILGTWLAARYAKRGVLRLLRSIDGISEELATTAARVVGYFLVLVGAGLALTVLGAEVQPVLAAAIIVGAVVVLALRGVADNFGASVILQTRKPVRLGDWVDLDGTLGRVTEMNARSVVLRTADGRQIHVPNARMMSNPIINLTVAGGVRAEVEIRSSDVARRDELARCAVPAAQRAPGVLHELTADLVWTACTPTALTGVLRFWHSADLGPVVASGVLQAVADELAAQGFDASLRTPPPAPPLAITSVP